MRRMCSFRYCFYLYLVFSKLIEFCAKFIEPLFDFLHLFEILRILRPPLVCDKIARLSRPSDR